MHKNGSTHEVMKTWQYFFYDNLILLTLFYVSAWLIPIKKNVHHVWKRHFNVPSNFSRIFVACIRCVFFFLHSISFIFFIASIFTSQNSFLAWSLMFDRLWKVQHEEEILSNPIYGKLWYTTFFYTKNKIIAVRGSCDQNEKSCCCLAGSRGVMKVRITWPISHLSISFSSVI